MLCFLFPLVAHTCWGDIRSFCVCCRLSKDWEFMWWWWYLCDWWPLGSLKRKKKKGGGVVLIHKGAYRSRQSCLHRNLCLQADVASAIHTPFVQHVSSAIHCSRKRTQNKPWSQMNIIPKQYNTEDVPLPLAEPGEFQINFSSWFLLSEIWSYI